MTLIMDKGETMHVRLRVINIENEPFRIISARYELWDWGTGEVIDSGEASILDHILDVVITPPEHGRYCLHYIYTIGDEVLIDKVQIRVTSCHV